MKNAVETLAPTEKGLLVRDPLTKQPLPEKGMDKPMIGSEGIYWKRQIRDGSVKIVKKEVLKKTEKKETYSYTKKGDNS